MLELSLIGSSAAIVSAIGVALLRRWAQRNKVLDIPNERSSHTVPVPRGGGLAAVFVVVGGLLCWLAWHPSECRRFLPYIAGAGTVALAGWIDDLRPLPVRLRLAIHVAAAITICLAVGYWTSITLPFFGVLRLGLFGAILSFLWIVGLTNAYNFMDGIDGIAGTQALIGSFAWLYLAKTHGDTTLLLLAVLTLGSSVGFLVHNWFPASIFMGDVGSVFLGFSFASFPFLLASSSPDTLASLPSPLLGFLPVFPFVLDTSATFIARLARREDIFAPHRSHLYQRLVVSGVRHANVALLYGALASIGAVLAVAVSNGVQGALGAAFVIPAAILVALFLFVRRRERLMSRGARPPVGPNFV